MAKRKSIIQRMDKKAREVIRLRDEGVCQWCRRNKGTDVHHIRRRKYYTTRWELNNLILLCRACHSEVENNPISFGIWFVKRYPQRQEIIDWKSKQKLKTRRDSDLMEIEDYLDDKLKGNRDD